MFASSASAHLTSSLVLPPDSEIVAPVLIRSPSGIQPGRCSLIEPQIALTESYGVLVGRTLVDALAWSASVLLVNPGSDVVVLPSFSCIGNLVPVSAVSVARSSIVSPGVGRTLPEHLEDIVAGSHPSLGGKVRTTLQSILHQYVHVFPAPGEPVAGRTMTVQHEIETSDARPVWCGPRRLAPSGLWTEQTCIQEMLEGGQIEPSDSHWASPVVLVTKDDGSTSFCVDYRQLNSLTVKDAYPVPHIDDSLRLLGNQKWFSTMDLASGYWQVAMSSNAKWKAAFVTHEGLYQCQVMPFGLCNATATFERLMDGVFVWHALVALFGLPGRCDFIWHDCAGGAAMPRGGPGAAEQVWIAA